MEQVTLKDGSISQAPPFGKAYLYDPETDIVTVKELSPEDALEYRRRIVESPPPVVPKAINEKHRAFVQELQKSVGGNTK